MVRRAAVAAIVSIVFLTLIAGPAGAAALLMRGDYGDSVLEVQKFLKARGFDPGPLDGDFGPMTEAAVVAFQKSRGLTPDGIVGPLTAQELRSEVSRAIRRPLAGKVIAIDPGHGGWNSGAVGRLGTREADHVLGIALYLEQMLKEAGARVIMTRRTDREVLGPTATDGEELGARAAIANNAASHIFVSIHNNAYEKDPNVSGAMAFYYGGNGTAAESYRLAKGLLYALCSSTGLQWIDVQTAGFRVLRSAQMPAVLMEIGFMTNVSDEKKLSTPAFRYSAAKGLYEGICNYFGVRAR